MSIRRVVPGIPTNCLDESRKFYTEFLGFEIAMDLGWIVTVKSPINPTAQISLLQNPAPPPSVQPIGLTIEVADVDAVHAKALALGIPIVYPLTNEPWGVRRFQVTDPNNVVVNVMNHIH